MIIRIVKMTFQEDKVDLFLKIFEISKNKIRAKEGCNHLKLLQDTHQKNVFFTYSYWDSENDLNNYRYSILFKEVWSVVKPLFKAKTEAWSTVVKSEVEK